MSVKKVQPMRGPYWRVGPNGTVVDGFTGRILFAAGPADRDANPAEEQVARALTAVPELIAAAEDAANLLEDGPRPSKALAAKVRVRLLFAVRDVLRGQPSTSR